MQGSMQCAHSRLRGLRAHGRSSSGAAAALAQPARSRGARATPVPGSQQPCGGLRPTSAQPRERPLPPLRTAGTAGGAVAVGDAPPGGQSGASSTASTSSSSSSLTPERAARLAAPVIIVGGGPAGLATALMLARRGYTNVKVRAAQQSPAAPTCAGAAQQQRGGARAAAASINVSAPRGRLWGRLPPLSRTPTPGVRAPARAARARCGDLGRL